MKPRRHLLLAAMLSLALTPALRAQQGTPSGG